MYVDFKYGHVYYYISKLRSQRAEVIQNHMYCKTKLDKENTRKKIRWVKRLSRCYGIAK